MLKIIVAAAVAVSFASLDVADAASKKKKQKVRATAPSQSMSRRRTCVTPGPPWAGTAVSATRMKATAAIRPAAKARTT